MNKYFILISLSFIFFLLFGTTYSQSFNKSWTRTYGNDSVAVVYDVVDMRIDRNNDLYVLGYKDTSSMTSVIVLSKYNQAGQLLFERLYVNPYNMDATPVAIAIDSNNNLYIGGYEQSLIPNHLTDFLVIKYDPSGNFQWKFNFNGITGMEDYLVGLKIDSLNNIYIVGTSYLTGDPTFFCDVATCKLDVNGTLIWTHYQNYPQNTNIHDTPASINLDRQGNIILNGNFTGGNMCKLDSAGNLLWMTSTPNGNYINDIQIDDSSSIYFVGALQLTKLDSSGNYLWSKNLGFSQTGSLFSMHLATNSISVSGNLDSVGNSKCITMKLDMNGDTIWRKIFSSGTKTYEYGRKIFENPNGDIRVAGLKYDSTYNYNFIELRYSSSGLLTGSSEFDDSLHMRDYYRSSAFDISGNLYLGGMIFETSAQIVLAIDTTGNTTWINSTVNYQNHSDKAIRIIEDKSGNVITCGHDYGKFFLQDAVIIKYDPAGNMVWQTRIHYPPFSVKLNQITVDSFNNIYVCGFIVRGATDKKLFVAKLDSTGNILNQTEFNYLTNTQDEGHAIVADNNGNCYVTGDAKVSNTQYYALILKLGPAGNFLWSSIVEDSGYYHGYESLVMTPGNLLYCSYTDNSEFQHANKQDIGVAKLDTGGNIIWNRTFNSPASGIDQDYKLILDKNENVIITGTSDSILWNIAVIKYDSSGNFLWATRYPNNSSVWSQPADIKTDEQNNIYVTGSADGFVTLKLDANGNILWTNNSNSGVGNRIATGEDRIFVTGLCYDQNMKSNLIILVYDTLGNTIYTDSLASAGSLNSTMGNDIFYDGDGCFYVTGTTDNYQVMEDYITIKYCESSVGINPINKYENSISIFPNPSHDIITLSYVSIKSLNVTIEIYNCIGKLMYMKSVTIHEGLNNIELNNSFPSGVYFCMINTDEGKIVSKFLKAY